MAESMREQLAKLRPILLEGQLRAIPMVRILAEIPDINLDAQISKTREEVLKWVSERTGKLPDAAWGHESFDLDAPGNPVAGIRFQDNGADYWAIRLNDPDKRAPSHIWTTEVSIVQTGGKGLLGIRQVLMTRSAEVDITPGVPGVIHQVCKSVQLRQDDLDIRNQAWVLAQEADVDRLVQLINHPGRRLPVIVVSLPQCESTNAAVDIETLRRRSLGIAHVAIIPAELTFCLTNLVGKQMSVFLGAVRTYRPGCDTYLDNPFNHPLSTFATIASWGGEGPEAFINMMVNNAAQETLRGPDDQVPSFATVRQAATKQRREQAWLEHKSDAELLALAYEEIEALTEERESYLALAEEEERQRKKAIEQAEEAEARNVYLTDRIKYLERQLKGMNWQPREVTIPESIDDLQAWAEENLAGKVVVTPRALRAAKRGLFEDTTLIYRALLMMGEEYHTMRCNGGPETQAAFEEKLKLLGLTNTRTGDEARLKEQKDEFMMPHRGQHELLSWHLKNTGSTRDPKRCFRLYYFWSDRDSQVIVGSLPGHLHTRSS